MADIDLDQSTVQAFDNMPDLASPVDEAEAERDRMESIHREVVQSESDEISGSMYIASSSDPDRAAKARAMAERLKMPVGLVERNYDDFTRREKTEFARYDELLQSNPKLAEYLKDPENAKLVHDDIAGLKKADDAVQDAGILNDTYNGLQIFASRFNQAIGQTPALAYDFAMAPGNVIAKLSGHPEWQVRSPEWLRENDLTKWAKEQEKGFQAQVSERSQGDVFEVSKTHVYDPLVTGDFSKLDVGRASRVLFHQVMTNLPNQALILTAAAVNPAAGLAYAAASTAATKNAEAQATGQVDPATATLTALTHGGFEAMFESLGTMGLLKQWNGAMSKASVMLSRAR